MTDLSYSDLPVSGDTNNASDVTTPLNEIKSYINGQLTNSNLDGSAGITDANLASPNNSVYKTLLTSGGTLGNDAAAATYLLSDTTAYASGGSEVGDATLLASGGSILTVLNGTGVVLASSGFIYFDNDDFTVGSKTQKLRLRAQVNTNATAWSSVTATFGLYPVTFAGASDTLTITLGTVVSGSTVAIANPSASTTNQGNSGDFTVPSDGLYCIGVVTSATLTNNAAALLTAQLQTRNV